MLSRFVKPLNLPDVPKSLWPDLDLFDNDAVTPAWSNRPRTATKQGQVVGHSHYSRYDIDASLKIWIHDNIAEDYKNIGLSRMWGQPVNLPHTDHTRDVTMLYLFDCGGSQVYTKFWQRKGYPLHHDNQDPQYHYNHNQPDTYDDLDLVFSTVLQPFKWYMLDARCIHSVEGMTGGRVSLQLGFMKTSTWASEVMSDFASTT